MRVMPSVLLMAGSTITSTEPWAIVGALHFEPVLGTGSLIEVQVLPDGLF